MIDWDRPVEVFVDGAWIAAVVEDPADSDPRIGLRAKGAYYLVDDDGSPARPFTDGPRARNTPDSFNELAELRAFKETALASGYVPPKPVDPDLVQARSIAVDFGLPGRDGHGTAKTLNGDADGCDGVQACLTAIKWAHANPR